MACPKKCFTFTWKLENVSFCLEKKDEPIISPAFVVDSIDETKWSLEFFPRGEKDSEDSVGFFLTRDEDSKGNAEVSINYDLTFISEDRSVTLDTSINEESIFSKSHSDGNSNFADREEVFGTYRSAFLPKDTLTARCRIWKTDGEMAEDVHCLARTRIGVEKRSFLWKVKNFSTLVSGKTYKYKIKSLSHVKQLMSVNLSLTEGLSSEPIICFKLNLQDEAIKFSTLLLSLVDIFGNKIECNRDEFWFDNPSEQKEFKFVFTKKKLVAMKSSFLPNDILSLHWEWAFSKGLLSEEIEDVQYASITSELAPISFNSSNVNNQKMVPLSYQSVADSLKSFYYENFLCDVKLKTSTHMFNAHKVILSASSTVFRAMFSSSMEENKSDCIYIEDLTDETISQMLVYIYTLSIEDLTWENSLLLYAAADKYAIFSLKNICSSYMKENLSSRNACEVLVLAEFHSDSGLKSAVQDYILKNIKDTVNSDGWKLLMKTNSTLAAETLSRPYKEDDTCIKTETNDIMGNEIVQFTPNMLEVQMDLENSLLSEDLNQDAEVPSSDFNCQSESLPDVLKDNSTSEAPNFLTNEALTDNTSQKRKKCSTKTNKRCKAM